MSVVRVIYFCLILFLVACKENIGSQEDSKTVNILPSDQNDSVEFATKASDADSLEAVEQQTDLNALSIPDSSPQDEIKSQENMASFEGEVVNDSILASSFENLENEGLDSGNLEKSIVDDITKLENESPIENLDDRVLEIDTLENPTVEVTSILENDSPAVTKSNVLIEDSKELKEIPQLDINSEASIKDEALLAIPAINQIPIAVADEVSVIEDQVTFLSELLINDNDPDGDEIKIINVSPAKFGVVEIINERELKYSPLLDFNGMDTFQYTISDPQGEVSVAPVNVSVQNENDTPLARSDSYVLPQDLSSTLDVSLNDEGLGDNAILSIELYPANGKLELLSDNRIIFRPYAGYFGLDSFVYQLTDEDGESSTATVELDIECLLDCTRVFNLSWQPSMSEGVTVYRVYVGTVAHRLDTVFDIGDVTNFDYIANEKGEYYFAISAFNVDGIESEKSDIIRGVF